MRSALVLVLEVAARAEVVRASGLAQEDLVRKAVRAEGAQEAGVTCPDGEYDKTKGQAFPGLRSVFTSAKEACLPCSVDPDGESNGMLNAYSEAQGRYLPGCGKCELKDERLSDLRLVPECTECQHQSEVLLADEEGRVRCYLRDSEMSGFDSGVGANNDLCSAAMQTRRLPAQLRPLQKAAIWDVSWDNGKTWETIPVHMNDIQILSDQTFDPEQPGRKLRTAVSKAAEFGFTQAKFPDSPIEDRAHIVLLTFFPKYDNVREEMLTLMAGASRAPNSQSLAFLIGPRDHLYASDEHAGIIDIVSSHAVPRYGQRVVWKFSRGLLDLFGTVVGMDQVVESPLVRFSASNFKALGGCVEAMQTGGGTPPEKEGEYAREALAAAYLRLQDNYGYSEV